MLTRLERPMRGIRFGNDRELAAAVDNAEAALKAIEAFQNRCKDAAGFLDAYIARNPGGGYGSDVQRARRMVNEAFKSMGFPKATMSAVAKIIEKANR